MNKKEVLPAIAHSQAVTAPAIEMTPAQIELAKRTVMPAGSTDDELQLAVYVQNQTGLNLLTRQLYPIKVGIGKDERLTFQTSIDGFRLIAERTGKWAGQLGPFFTDGKACPTCEGKKAVQTDAGWQICPACNGDGFNWTAVWLSEDPPKAAKIGGLRKDLSEPVWSVAQWEAYAQYSMGYLCPACGFQLNRDKKDKTRYYCWTKIGGCGKEFKDSQLSGDPDQKNYIGWWAKGGGAHMLGKCAEALNKRVLFPQELSSLYTTDEMGQATMPTVPAPTEPPPPPARQRESNSSTSKTKAEEEEAGMTEYQKVCRRAKELGIDTARKSMNKLKAEIALKEGEAKGKQENAQTAKEHPLADVHPLEDGQKLSEETLQQIEMAFSQFDISMEDLAKGLQLPYEEWDTQVRDELLKHFNKLRKNQADPAAYKSEEE